jgi:uncharacterized damage-inducible protein DinB
MRNHFKKLFDYNTWANQKIVESLANQVTNEKSTIALLAHLLIAEKVWLSRILKSDEKIDELWLSISIGKCRKMSEENSAVFFKIIDEINDEKLEEFIEYQTAKKQMYSNKLSDILIHVINHGSYHRAQINTAIKQNGGDPVALDYIFYARNA